MEQTKIGASQSSNGILLTSNAYLRAANEYNLRLRTRRIAESAALAKSIAKKSKSKEKLDPEKLIEVARTLRMMDEI